MRVNGGFLPVRGIACLSLSLIAACAPDARGGSDGELRLAPSTVRVVGSAEMLGRAMDVQPEAGGSVWVLNNTEPFFIALSADGAVTETSGRRGGGPQEFRAPTGLVAGDVSGDVWAFDRTRHVLIRISGEWREVALPRDSVPVGTVLSFDNAGMFGVRPWLVRNGDAFLFTRTRPNVDASLRLWNADLVRLDAATGAVRTIIPIADLLGDPIGKFGAVQFLMPFPMWSLCGDGSFVLYDPLRNGVRRFDGAGVETGGVDLPAERAVPVTHELVFAMAYRQALAEAPAGSVDSVTMRREYDEGMRGIQNETSRVFPEYSDMHCDGSGAVWLQRFAVDEGILGRGAHWLRVEANGDIREVSMPARFQPLRFRGSTVWGVFLDEDDVPHVARIDLE